MGLQDLNKINGDIQKEHWSKIVELMPLQAFRVMEYWINLRRALNASRQ